MQLLVSKDIENSELKEIVNVTLMDLDIDGDGKLNYSEFQNVVNFVQLLHINHFFLGF